MFAARLRDENAINEQQAAAAAKPLNQGIKGLAPKTPGNPKTPFKSTRNDENANQTLGKGGAKGGKPERNAFVTPANPKTTRAPLGNKTTNAKALQTPLLNVPGNAPASTKPTSPRLRRSKIRVHETIESAEDVLAKDPEEREIEYMPPRGVPLNDDPDDILTEPMNLDALKGNNLTRGWWSEYAPKKDEDDSELSDFGEKVKKVEAQQAKRLKSTDKPAVKPATSRTTAKPAPTTMRAQNAASALGSRPTARPTVPGSSAPSVKARQLGTSASSSVAKKPVPGLGNPRFTAAKVASNSTIGYSKGRAVSASNRRPLSDLHFKSQSSQHNAAHSSDKTSLAELLNLGSLDIAEEDADLGFSAPSANSGGLLDGEEEEEVFQLDPVEDL